MALRCLTQEREKDLNRTESTALLALRTQQGMAYESGVAEVIDCLAGSVLRREPHREVHRAIERIEGRVGMLTGIEQVWARSAKSAP